MSRLVFTAVLVSFAVVVFAVVLREAIDPLRTYRRVALVALVVSFVPDVFVGAMSLFGWPLAVIYVSLHVGGSLSVAALQAVITGHYQNVARVENHDYVPADGFSDILPLVIAPIGLMAFGLAIVVSVWRHSRDHRRSVADFIVATCQGIKV